MKRRIPAKKLVRTAEWPYAKAESFKDFKYKEEEISQVQAKPIGVNTLRIMKMKAKDIDPNRFYYSQKDRVFIGNERDLRWLVKLILRRASLPGRRMELKTVKGEIINSYELPE